MSTISKRRALVGSDSPREQAAAGSPDSTATAPSWVRRGARTLIVGGVVVGALAAAVWLIAGGMSTPNQQLVFYKVKRGDLHIKVTERGTLQSQDNIEVMCEVDDIDGDGVRGIPIEWIIRNGATVEENDLIIEFASAGHQERYDRQILDTEQARSEQIQARATYENQITQNETTKQNAELEVRLTNLQLDMYTDQESGTHQLEVEEIERMIDDINNEILAAQATMELKSNEKRGAQELFKLGYAGRSEVEQYRLDLLQAESQVAAKENKLRTQLATLKKKKTFEREMQVLTLQGAKETAKRNLEQAIRDNEALLEQARAAKEAADEALRKEEERLERYKMYLDKCKVYAPASGMVAYAVADSREYWLDEIREGATVRLRQHVLSLPNLKRMQVRTSVHESMLEQVQAGLPATVRIEAFPDRQYKGKVKSIAVLAVEQGSDTKVYDTIVTIDGEVDGLRPGMTAVVDIHAARFQNVISVPIQAVTQLGDDTYCYVESDKGVERRDLKLGRTNLKFVEVEAGLNEGDNVVLNPMAIQEEQDESDLKEDDFGVESNESPESGGENGEGDSNPRPSSTQKGRGRPASGGDG